MEINKNINSSAPFCTCTDHKCPFNPVNHEKGCTFCIAKCIKEREIPSCFFNMLDLKEKPKGYTFEDFSKLVLQKTIK